MKFLPVVAKEILIQNILTKYGWKRIIFNETLNN